MHTLVLVEPVVVRAVDRAAVRADHASVVRASLGLEIERLSRPRDAADAYWWAYQLDPTSAEALYGRYTAQLMSAPTRLVEYWQGNRRVVRSREVVEWLDGGYGVSAEEVATLLGSGLVATDTMPAVPARRSAAPSRRSSCPCRRRPMIATKPTPSPAPR